MLLSIPMSADEARRTRRSSLPPPRYTAHPTHGVPVPTDAAADGHPVRKNWSVRARKLVGGCVYAGGMALYGTGRLVAGVRHIVTGGRPKRHLRKRRVSRPRLPFLL